MKFAAVFTGAILITATYAQARSDRTEPQPGRQVFADLNSPPAISPVIRLRAKRLASEMFSEIGVNLIWRARQSSTPTPILLSVTSYDSAECGHALACAYPYEGVHIHIFWNRIANDQLRPETAHIFLAHVIVHEITHILQGVEHHSPEGIMKARWSLADRSAMKKHPLPFAPEDVLLIQNGMDARDSRNSRATTSLVSRR